MPYRAIALVAAGLLLATQCCAEPAVGTRKSNTDRMGGGGGGKGAAGVTTVKSSKSNSSDRMGGGGGKSGQSPAGLQIKNIPTGPGDDMRTGRTTR